MNWSEELEEEDLYNERSLKTARWKSKRKEDKHLCKSKRPEYLPSNNSSTLAKMP
jgi:hypothetical protein